jgi:ankyrin repeat protein
MDDTLSTSSPLAKRLLHKGFNPSGKELSKGEALRWAAKECNIELVRLLIAEGVDVNLKNNLDEKAFHLAAQVGACDIMLALYQAGAAIDGNKSDQTPLHYAAMYGHAEAVRLLVTVFKVQVDVRDDTGWTPAATTARTNLCSMLQLLRDLGADIAILDDDEWSLLHHACRCGCVEVAKLLVEWGLSTTLVDKYHYTPLHRAVDSDQLNAT